MGYKKDERQTTAKLGTKELERKRSLRLIKQAGIAQEQQQSESPIMNSKGIYYNLNEEVEIPKGLQMAYYNSKKRFKAKKVN